MPGKSILLLFCAFFVLVLGWSITPAQAHECAKHKNQSHKHCPEPPSPPPGGDGTECEIDFCIEFTQGSNKITRDDGNYCHGTDKVLAFTGKGPGFRFDTNRSQKLEGAGGFRFLKIDLSDFDPNKRPFKTEDKGVDFRFDKSQGGLNLCTQDGPVGLTITFEVIGAPDNANTLAYGAPVDEDPSCGNKVTVTRTAGTGTTGTWTIEGTQACLRKGAVGVDFRPLIDGPHDARFSATLTAQ